MANERTYRIDPNVFLQQALAGVAQSPADRTAAAWASILADVNAGGSSYETLDTTATSLDLTVYESRLTVSGTMAFTLPNGTYVGQQHKVRCISAASTPIATLTVTTPETNAPYVCASTFVFDTAGQSRTFEWTENSKWKCIGVEKRGGTANNVVVGTTVLTGYSNWNQYNLSVTGTVSSTGTRALPNGSCIGERCTIMNTTAASTPIGNINGTFRGGAATAYTDLGAIGVAASTTATGDMAILEWEGTAWVVLYQTGCTLA